MKTIGIYLYNEVEVLDFAGPFEVFSTVSRIHGNQAAAGEEPLFTVVTIAEKRQNITARGGLQIQPQYSLHNHPALDLLVMPGGVVDDEVGKKEVISWLCRVADDAEIIASVCTGAFFLAEAGLLHQRAATTHWEDIAEFRRRFPEIRVLENRRWVDCNKIVTSAGISAGIDMSLHLVRRLSGHDWAGKTARQMQYTWIDQDRFDINGG